MVPAQCSTKHQPIFSNLVEAKISLNVERFCVGAFNCQLGFIYSAVYCREQIKAFGPIKGKHFSLLSSALFYT